MYGVVPAEQPAEMHAEHVQVAMSRTLMLARSLSGVDTSVGVQRAEQRATSTCRRPAAVIVTGLTEEAAVKPM